MKYKVVESTQEYLKDIEFEYDFDSYAVGDDVDILGQKVTISQLGSGVVGASSMDCIIFVQEVMAS